MIDISLMAKLMRAMPQNARLILLGDSQQLASVESGAVLANLSEAEQGQFSEKFIEQFPCSTYFPVIANESEAIQSRCTTKRPG